MSKIESTAVNDLIDLVQRKPLLPDSDEELLFTAPPVRFAKATQPPPLFAAAPPKSAPKAVAPQLFPVEQDNEPTEARATMPVISTRMPVFEPTPRDQTDLATMYVARQMPTSMLVKKLALPAGLLIALGVALGGVVTLAQGRKHSGTHVSAPSTSPFRIIMPAPAAPAVATALPTQPSLPVLPTLPPPQPTLPVAPPREAPHPALPAPTAPAQPAPALPPTVTPPAPPSATPAAKLVEVRVESTPAGATATLVDNGRSTPLGTTPVDATVDPSHGYDLVITLAGHPTKVEHFDPSTTQHVEVALADEVAAPKKAIAKPKMKRPATTRSRAVAARASAPARTVAAAPARAAGAGNGTLVITTTTACAILIDGKNTGLSTPQKAITLPAGRHQVRLIAATAHVNKLFGVDITARHTSKLVESF